MEHQDRKMANGYGIFSLWVNWALGVGSLMVILFISPMIDKVWLPLIAFTLELFLYALVRRNREARLPVCYLIPFIATRVLFWAAVIMVLINMLHLNNFMAVIANSSEINPEIPYISVLIVAPITLAITAWAYKKGHKLNYCMDCLFRHGTAAERGFLGNIFSQEGRYQVRMLMLLSLLLSVSSWIYYAFFYININLNRPDRFFFVWLPILLYVLSLLYLGIRYFSLWTYYCQNIEGSPLRHGSSTLLRYIIICGDHIYLKRPDPDKDNVGAGEDKYDTPAHLYISYHNRVSDYEADNYMKGLSGLSGCDIRLMYLSTNFNADCNIYHYACFIDSKDIVEQSRIEGEWFTIDHINKLLCENNASMLLGSELNRIYTISMAWKTYDRAGRRLYNMRNYKPTFRLRDFKDWDVDLNDPEWLYVSVNNEDRPFYRIKRFWRRYVNGIGE